MNKHFDRIFECLRPLAKQGVLGAAALGLCLISAAGFGRAQSIAIVSGDDPTGTLEWNLENGVGVPNTVITPNPLWAMPSQGGKWVGVFDTGGAGLPVEPLDSTIESEVITGEPSAVFVEKFTLPTASAAGGITVYADDTVEVFLNGVKLVAMPSLVRPNVCVDIEYSPNGGVSCEQDEGVYIDLSNILPGTHTLEFHAYQLWGGPFGVLYEGHVELAPGTGFVTGGGWIQSPAGAYEGSQEGKATFGFVAKYNPGGGVPAGNLEFQLHSPHLNYKSTGLDWLLVSRPYAQFAGTGTLNGVGGYYFLVTLEDGGRSQPDRFRIKIWDGDHNLVYDSLMGLPSNMGNAAPLDKGSIQIHR